MTLPSAHGGRLKPLLLPETPAGLERLPVLKLTPRQQCDVEMLLGGAFSPLTGFLGRDDYLAVLQTQRLADGTLWPVPIVLDVDRATLDAVGRAGSVLLLDAELNAVAVLRAGEAWRPDRGREAKLLFGTDDPRDARARALLHDTASHYLSGKLEGVRLPVCRYLGGHRTTPAQQRELLERDGAVACLAAMPRNPLYRAGVVALARAVAASRADHLLLLHNPDGPPLGALPGRVTARCLTAVLPRLERLARPTYCRFARWPRFAGSREAVWSAIVAQNYGATHMLLPDIAADDPQAAPAHRSRQSEELLEAARRELAIRLVDAGPGASMAGGQMRTVIEAGGEAALRACFSEEIEILETHHRRGSARGFALLLTGLSGAGKSSLAHALADRLERGFGRAVTVLDGDYSRYLLASDLTGVREDHRRNVARHALVAAEIVRHGGTVICALVAPEAAARADARAAVECNGRFIEIYLAASAATCRERDQKGIYARGRAGLLGIAPPALGDGYEVPEHPEIIADSANHGVEELTAQVIDYLIAQRLVERPANQFPA